MGRHQAIANALATEPTASDFVDDRALAKRTPIARVTWQTWRRVGEGPPVYRIGTGKRSRCLYRWSEVVEWLEQHRVGASLK